MQLTILIGLRMVHHHLGTLEARNVLLKSNVQVYKQMQFNARVMSTARIELWIDWDNANFSNISLVHASKIFIMSSTIIEKVIRHARP